MTPEDLIQAAFVERSNRDRDARKADGFYGPQATWPAWAPEVAAAALRKEGLLNVDDVHPSSSDPISNFVAPHDIDERLRTVKADRDAFIAAVCSDLTALNEAETTLDQAMRDIADAGEWPEVAS